MLKALRPLGTVGPMGEAPITADDDGPPRGWAIEAEDPQFYVVDDEWHDDNLWTKVECDAALVTTSVLQALLTVTSQWKGATVGISLGERAKGYILVATGRLLVKGPLFPRSCVSPRDVVARCQEAAKKLAGGPPQKNEMQRTSHG